MFDNGGDGPGCPRHVARVEVFTYDLGSMTVRRARSISFGLLLIGQPKRYLSMPKGGKLAEPPNERGRE